MKYDSNRASQALCHAKAIVALVGSTCDDRNVIDALSAAMTFINDAKAMIDGEDRRTQEPQS